MMTSDPIDDCGSPRTEYPPGMLARARALAQRFPLASKGMLSIFDQAIVSGTSFLTVAIIARTTSPDLLGFYYLVLSIVLVVSGVQEQLIAAPYAVYSKRRAGRELAEYAASAWLHHLVLTALMTAGLILAIIACSATGSRETLNGLWALLGAGPLLLLRDAIRRFSFANLHVKAVVPLDAFIAAAQLGGLAVLGYFGWLSLWSIYAVMGAACALACLGWYVLNPPTVRFVRERLRPDWRQNWSFGRWALPSYLLGCTTPFIVLWILTFSQGAAASGVLGACVTLVGVTNIILAGVANILTPQAARAFVNGGAKDLQRVLSLTATFFGLTFGAFALFILLTGDWLTVFVYGAAYHGTGAILFTLALAVLMNSFGNVTGNGLWAINQPRLNLIADVCGMAATLIVAVIAIPPLGAFGAALTTLASAATAAVVRTITLLRQLEGGVAEPGVVTTSAFPA